MNKYRQSLKFIFYIIFSGWMVRKSRVTTLWQSLPLVSWADIWRMFQLRREEWFMFDMWCVEGRECAVLKLHLFLLDWCLGWVAGSRQNSYLGRGEREMWWGERPSCWQEFHLAQAGRAQSSTTENQSQGETLRSLHGSFLVANSNSSTYSSSSLSQSVSQ